MPEAAKRIEEMWLEVGELKHGFGNPRKITAKKMRELESSLEQLGDFGIFIIDENKNLIGGNQRATVLCKKDPHTKVLCKMLIGYTEAELRAVNIVDNTHAGDWDLDVLSSWTADLNLDIGINAAKKEIDERTIPDMDPIRFERYDYVIIACNNEIDYNELIRNLGIEGAKVKVAKRKLKARAVWYHDIKAQIIPKKDVPKKETPTEEGDE